VIQTAVHCIIIIVAPRYTVNSASLVSLSHSRLVSRSYILGVAGIA